MRKPVRDQDEQVKILDFGLAKLTEHGPASTDVSQLTTAVLGTAGYMAPEQVRGEATDHRSDLYAIGAILYEMLTGRGAFRRETRPETLTAILREDPPDMTGPTSWVPPALARLIAHCLEKKPADRFQSGRDLAFALETIGSLPAAFDVSTRATLAPRRVLWRWMAVAAALLTLAAGAFGTWRLLARRAPSNTEVRAHRLTDTRGLEEFPAISADGKSITFVTHTDGKAQIYVRLVQRACGWSTPTARGCDSLRLARSRTPIQT